MLGDAAAFNVLFRQDTQSFNNGVDQNGQAVVALGKYFLALEGMRHEEAQVHADLMIYCDNDASWVQKTGNGETEWKDTENHLSTTKHYCKNAGVSAITYIDYPGQDRPAVQPGTPKINHNPNRATITICNHVFKKVDGQADPRSSDSSGNWAVLDQYAAVKWVHENIAAFGGDPNHISAIGQSFGAAATYHIVNSNMTADLGIVNAISESGVRSPSDPQVGNYECGYLNQTAALTLGSSILAGVNVTSISEGRALDYNTILDYVSDAGLSFGIKPSLDYYAIPEKYIDIIQNGAGNKVPYITGNNADEDGASSQLTATVADYKEWLTQQYGSYASKFLNLYPAANDTQAAESETALIRDQFCVSSWQYMDGFSQSSGVPAYTYFWDYAPPGGSGLSGHASEVVYALGYLFMQTGNAYTAEDYCVSNVTSSYWANFMKTGNPNQGGSYTNGTLPATWTANAATANETFDIGSS
ncbi:hypothetical protein BOTCAL_0500g00030 [Botryotinia calthae]|uniref:Carboxylesterase type B domain-containing protein n=1 Tax=Botryotinia calthae TaxID=38488 RepID=A0A4Y8CLG8_9HELO|nr:hypothetical protein BOTCAL_0500g00030 [Botryotinia calthae]